MSVCFGIAISYVCVDTVFISFFAAKFCLLRFHCSFYGLNILLFSVVCSFCLRRIETERKKEIRTQYIKRKKHAHTSSHNNNSEIALYLNCETESLKPSNIPFNQMNSFLPIMGQIEFGCGCCCCYFSALFLLLSSLLTF